MFSINFSSRIILKLFSSNKSIFNKNNFMRKIIIQTVSVNAEKGFEIPKLPSLANNNSEYK